MLQYGNVEAFLRIVNHADSETQSMVQVTPAEYSRYRYQTDNTGWTPTTVCIPVAKY